jgi:hypothetical protein
MCLKADLSLAGYLGNYYEGILEDCWNTFDLPGPAVGRGADHWF